MNKIIKSVYAGSIALLLSLGTTAANAGSGDFAGIYGAVYGSAGGAQIDGTHSNKDASEVASGVTGGAFPLGGYEVGFNLPLGDLFFIGVGRNKTMSGKATITSGVDHNGGQDGSGNDATFTLRAKSMTNTFIMPSMSIYENSAIYLKYGKSIAALQMDGGVNGTAYGTPNNLQGDVVGIGTITMTNSGLFMKTEATLTSYDDLRIIGAAGSASAIVEGTPDVVQGTVAVGYKF